VVLGVQVHVPLVFAQGVEDGFSPSWPPGLTEELKCAGGALLVLAAWEGLAGMGVMVLAGALETGAGAGALDLGGAGAGTSDLGGVEGAALDDAGAGAWLEGAATTVEAGTELGLGAVLLDGHDILHDHQERLSDLQSRELLTHA
jgi:hypothetical protein